MTKLLECNFHFLFNMSSIKIPYHLNTSSIHSLTHHMYPHTLTLSFRKRTESWGRRHCFWKRRWDHVTLLQWVDNILTHTHNTHNTHTLIHTHTHTFKTHTRTHSHTHTHTHTLIHTIHTLTHTHNTHTHTHTHTHTLTHSLTHTHTHSHSHTHLLNVVDSNMFSSWFSHEIPYTW